MPPFELCGPSYTSQAPNLADQLTMNLYPESSEGQGQSPIALYSTPGTEVFCNLVDTPVRGSIVINDRYFAVGGSRFYEVDSAGTKTSFGLLINDSKLVSMAGGTTQILIASAGACYVFDITTNTFTALVGGTFLGPISQVGYIDGFFIAFLKNSNQFQWSSLLDATVWDPLDTQKVSVFTGNVLSMLIDHREILFWGERQTQVYYDSGSASVFDIVPGGFIEAGIFAPNSPVRLDNSILWLGGDERGAGVVWRAQGYTPQRVSNHAIEFALQGYLTKYGQTGLNDAIGYSYQDQGHGFYVLYFPTANATWVYDVATGMWHQRGYWVASNGIFTAHRSQCHAFAFGKHLVGDWATGNIYNMSISLFDDAGNPIRRVRRAPHVSEDQEYRAHTQLQIYLESGLGPQPPLFTPSTTANSFALMDSNNVLWSVSMTDAGILQTTLVATGTPATLLINDDTLASTTWQMGVNTSGMLTVTSITFDSSQSTTYGIASSPSGFAATIAVSSGLLVSNVTSSVGDPDGRDPMINMRQSKDGGHTWGNERSVGAGKAGEYTKRVIFRRLGRARDCVYEISMSDPIPWRIVGAYLKTGADAS